tara:strand:- start:13042 stop:13209 length:168 start_codon:yes stop_codon:yes gene_type:complete
MSLKKNEIIIEEEEYYSLCCIAPPLYDLDHSGPLIIGICMKCRDGSSFLLVIEKI